MWDLYTLREGIKVGSTLESVLAKNMVSGHEQLPSV